MKQSAAVLVLSLLSTVVLANSGVLIDHVPAGAPKPIVVAVMKQSLISHGWHVDAEDDKSVRARIGENVKEAWIVLTYADGKIRFEGVLAMPNMGVPWHNRPAQRDVNIPKRWLRLLRSDIAAALATQPEVPPP